MTIDVLDEDGASNIMHPELFGKPNKSELLKHLDKCEKIVQTWPKWKTESIRDAFGLPNPDKAEVTRSEFENYIREQGYSSDFQLGSNGQYKSDLMHFMFTTWCYQQSKLDGLQKQVDKALGLLQDTTAPWEEITDQLEKILEGSEL